jgi:hypothetical protein
MGGRARAQAQQNLGRVSAFGAVPEQQARTLYGIGTPSLQQYQQYLQGVMKGGQPLIQATAPQIQNAEQQFNVAERQIANAPRDFQNRYMQDLRLREAAAKTGIYSGAQAAAPGQLGQLGLASINAALGAGQQTIGAGLGTAQGYLNLAQQQAALAENLGAGIGGLLAAPLMGTTGGGFSSILGKVLHI